MTVKNTRGSDLIWESLTPEGKSWFNADFAILDFKSNKTTNLETSLLLMKIFISQLSKNQFIVMNILKYQMLF